MWAEEKKESSPRQLAIDVFNSALIAKAETK